MQALVGGLIFMVIFVGALIGYTYLNEEQNKTIVAGVKIDAKNNQINKEKVHIENTGTEVRAVNNAQNPLNIVEYRVLDDSGKILYTCEIDQTLRPGAIENLEFDEDPLDPGCGCMNYYLGGGNVTWNECP